VFLLSCGIDLPCSFPIFVRLLFSRVIACSKESSNICFRIRDKVK
jgi:hypothetical protein